MTDFSGIFHIQTTGFHGFVENFLNVGGKKFQKVEQGYTFEKKEKINISKIIALAFAFIVTIPALIALAICRAGLDKKQICTKIDDGRELDLDGESLLNSGRIHSQGPAKMGGGDGSDLTSLRAEFKAALESSKKMKIKQKREEFKEATEVFRGLYLHGMAVDNWEGKEVENTVVVQGRQNPKEYNWPLESHSALLGANVHYFHPTLEKMDALIILNKLEGKTKEDARNIAKELLTNLTFTAYTVYSEDIEVSFEGLSEKQKEDALTGAILEHGFKARPLKLIMNFEHGKEEEVEAEI